MGILEDSVIEDMAYNHLCNMGVISEADCVFRFLTHTILGNIICIALVVIGFIAIRQLYRDIKEKSGNKKIISHHHTK